MWPIKSEPLANYWNQTSPLICKCLMVWPAIGKGRTQMYKRMWVSLDGAPTGDLVLPYAWNLEWKL